MKNTQSAFIRLIQINKKQENIKQQTKNIQIAKVIWWRLKANKSAGSIALNEAINLIKKSIYIKCSVRRMFSGLVPFNLFAFLPMENSACGYFDYVFVRAKDENFTLKNPHNVMIAHERNKTS